MKKLILTCLTGSLMCWTVSCGSSSEEINNETEAKTESTATKELDNMIKMIQDGVCIAAMEVTTGQAQEVILALDEQGCVVKELEGEFTTNCEDTDENNSTCSCLASGGEYTFEMVKEGEKWMVSSMPDFATSNQPKDAVDELIEDIDSLAKESAEMIEEGISEVKELKEGYDAAVEVYEEITK